MKAALVALVAATSMAAAPAVAAPAASLSVAKSARVAAPAKPGEKLGGAGSGRFLIAAAVTAAIVAGIFFAAHEIGSDDPDSN